MIDSLLVRFLRMFMWVRELELETQRERDRISQYAGELQAKDLELEEVREALEARNRENLLLQDRVDSAREDRGKLWELLRDRLQAADSALKMQVNVGFQRSYGISPYPDEVKLPSGAEADLESPLSTPRRMTPSEAMGKQTQRFVQELRAKLTQVK